MLASVPQLAAYTPGLPFAAWLLLQVQGPSMADNPFLQLFKDGTSYLAAAIEAGAALIIGLAAAQAIILSLVLFVRQSSVQDEKENVRLSLGRWLALALEFELAADILRTAVAPTWNEIGQLAAIVVLRTVLNYFLQQEIDKAAQRAVPPAVVPTAEMSPEHSAPATMPGIDREAS